MSEKLEPRLDPEFQSLSLLTSQEEDDLLKASLKNEGCREPIVVWAETGAILDGHRRYLTCFELGIKYKVKTLSFSTKEAAHDWVVANQLARRNLTAEQKSYLRGKRYLAEKKSHGRQSGEIGVSSHRENSKTSERLAMSYGVSRATICRDGEFAQAVDAIAEVMGSAKNAIIDGSFRIPRKELLEIAGLEKEHRRLKMEALHTGKMVKDSPFKPPYEFDPQHEVKPFSERVRAMICRWPPAHREFLAARLRTLARETATLPYQRKRGQVISGPCPEPATADDWRPIA